MNEQLIFRTTDTKEFEILSFESSFFDTKKFQRKTLTSNSLIDLLTNYTKKNVDTIITHHSNIFETDTKSVVAYTKTNVEEIYILKINERYIMTFYNNKLYKVIHPNCFIKIIVKENLVQRMFIYPYKKYDGLNTILYDNPFPNIFSSNETCMGSSDRTLKETKIKTVLSIIETAYTHAYTHFKSEQLKSTADAFLYLSKNKFPYDELMSSNLTLKDLIERCKNGK